MVENNDTERLFLSLLVLQGSPFCNIDCDYCYLPDRSITRRMSMDVLKKTIERICEAELVGPPFDILWHAGEPLALPVSYYERAAEVVREFPETHDKATFVYQTNAMLITQEWCDFLNSENALVGVSLDGPAFIHDLHRKTRRGDGTHAKAMDGVRKLQENDIPFPVVAVITETSLDHPDEIFQFFLELKCTNVGFNIEEIEGANNTSSLSAAGAERRLRKFFSRLYELNRQRDFALSIREFDDARQRILNPAAYLNNEPIPFSMINVDCDGNFSTFSPELLGQKTEKYGSFSFGNVVENRIFDATQNPVFQSVLNDIVAGNQKCSSTCSYHSFCQGASPSNKYFENQTFDSTETMHCRSVIQTPVDIVRLDIDQNGYWPPNERENREEVAGRQS